MILGQPEETKQEEKRRMIKDSQRSGLVERRRNQLKNRQRKNHLREELAPKLIESSPEFDESFSAFMMFEAEGPGKRKRERIIAR